TRSAILGDLPASVAGAYREICLRIRRRAGASGGASSAVVEARRSVCRRNGNPDVAMAARIGIEPQFTARRAGLPVRPADSRHRAAGHPLCALLPFEEGPDGPLFLVLPALHGLHAGGGAF